MTVPPVVRSAWVNRPLEEAFAVFTDQIGAWWPLPTHGLASVAGSVGFSDGALIEQAAYGTQITWGEVLEWDAPNQVVLAWHPGQERSEASEVEVAFVPDGEGTRVVIEHRGWDGFGADAMKRRKGYAGPNAWGHVLDHYADLADVRPDAADLSGLAASYEQFFAEADKGGFGSAPEGEWNAEQVVAHVALNDAGMLGVCQALVHQTEARFENLICQDLGVLANYIERHDGMAGLIESGRKMADLVLAALSRLSPEQLQTPVACYLMHYDDVMVDADMPWETVAINIQAGRHLPAHVEQLQNLRT